MRLIDADALKELRHNYIQGKIKFDGNEYDLIDKCPTIDAVEVVRCKDCLSCEAKFKRNGEVYFYRCNYFDIEIEPLAFCSCGERRNSDGKLY